MFVVLTRLISTFLFFVMVFFLVLLFSIKFVMLDDDFSVEDDKVANKNSNTNVKNETTHENNEIDPQKVNESYKNVFEDLQRIYKEREESLLKDNKGLLPYQKSDWENLSTISKKEGFKSVIFVIAFFLAAHGYVPYVNFILFLTVNSFVVLIRFLGDTLVDKTKEMTPEEQKALESLLKDVEEAIKKKIQEDKEAQNDKKAKK